MYGMGHYGYHVYGSGKFVKQVRPTELVDTVVFTDTTRRNLSVILTSIVSFSTYNFLLKNLFQRAISRVAGTIGLGSRSTNTPTAGARNTDEYEDD